MRLEEIEPLLRRRPPSDEPVPGTLMIGPDDDVDVLLAYFGADRSRRAVRLVVGGRPLGYVARADVYSFFPTRTKGLGDSVGAVLPGLPPPGAYRLLTLACPVQGCPVGPILTTRYDVDAPPTCERHPDRALQEAR